MRSPPDELYIDVQKEARSAAPVPERECLHPAVRGCDCCQCVPEALGYCECKTCPCSCHGGAR